MADESAVQHDTDAPPTEPSSEPAVAIPDERIPYSVTRTWNGVPLTAELRDAVDLVNAALVVARAEDPGIIFSDLSVALYLSGVDA